MSKFRRSDFAESSSYSSADSGDTEEEDAPVSPLALMSENSPEAWLGQFLQILDIGGLSRYSTVKGARQDANLISQLQEIWRSAAEASPLRVLDDAFSEELKLQDWGAWWQAQEQLGKYCYSALALSMLGDKSHAADLATIYRQSANMRLQKDAHFVLCYMLGKEWPAYRVTDADLAQLEIDSGK